MHWHFCVMKVWLRVSDLAFDREAKSKLAKMQIDHSNIREAVKLLQIGFPHRSAEFWERGFARMARRHSHNLENEPLGHLLRSGEDFVGLGLTPVSFRHFGTEQIPRRIVNLSSWFVLPEHRSKLPLLLRTMMSDKNAIYTDLTPTKGVEKILEVLSFAPLNGGTAVAIAPVVAVFPSHQVTAWRAQETRDFSQNDIQLLEEHDALGCKSMIIHTETHRVPLILCHSKIRGVRAMKVIYCPDREALHGALGAICRKLVTAGKALLLFDLPTQSTPTFPPSILRFPNWRRRYVRGGQLSGGIDHCYSELVHFRI